MTGPMEFSNYQDDVAEALDCCLDEDIYLNQHNTARVSRQPVCILGTD